MAIHRSHRGMAFLMMLMLLLGAAATPAAAAVTITARETGGNVVFTSAGSLNLSGLTRNPSGTTTLFGGINTTVPYVVLGASPVTPVTVDLYQPTSIPAAFGTDPNNKIANVGSGPRWGVFSSRVYVPTTYASGDSLAGSLAFNGATFQSLGITPGTYVWSWANDTVTLKVVPVPAALPLMATALVGLGVIARRRRAAA